VCFEPERIQIRKELQMKVRLFLFAVLFGLAQVGQTQDLDTAPPVVVKTVPEAGSKDVPPGEFEVRITFSKPMTDQSWSWSSAWQGSDPQPIGKPHYDADHRTCIMKVKLEPGKTYGWWLNSPKFHGFQDRQHRPAVPYLLIFRTKDK
jgi:hypothetical protein